MADVSKGRDRSDPDWRAVLDDESARWQAKSYADLRAALPDVVAYDREGPGGPYQVEVQLLEDAHRELSAGRAARALALLDEHGARFPSGELRGERMAARVFALCELGRIDEARRAAELFLAFAPSSPLVPRVRASCALR